MQKFLTDISSIYWWIGVVLVGIVINLFSSYLKNKIDSFMGKISELYAIENERKKELYAGAVRAMIDNPQLMNAVLFYGLSDRINATHFFIYSLLLSVIGYNIGNDSTFFLILKVLFFLTGTIFFIMGVKGVGKANDKACAVWESITTRHRLEEQKKENASIGND